MVQKIDWLRRFLATTLGFIFWGVAGVLLQLYLLRYAKKTHSLNEQLKARKKIGKIWSYFVRYLSWSGVLKVEYLGFEKLGRPGQLVIANHPSLLDVVLILSRQSEIGRAHV